MNRKKFLKTSIITLIGTLFFPKVLKGNDEAEDLILEYKPNPNKWKDEEINIAWLGHSTVLISFYGTILLTDPVLLKRIGVYLFGTSVGPARLTPPALTIEELPKPDIVLLSHAHLDHMDYPTLKKITNIYPNEIECVTAHLTKDVIQDLKWKSLNSLDWNETLEVAGIKFTGLEVKHFGWRFPWEKDRSRGYMKDGRSYNAYLFEKNGKSILFGGDTTMTDKLNVIKNEKVDVAIMPIGAYNPWRHVHCTPEEALKMSEDVNAEYFIPIHTKTFRQGIEPFEEAIDWLNKSIVNYKIKLALNSIGQTFTLS
ncbi:MAG: Zn-dependent hydrolase [Ignavibacteriae bacterium]|nr:MAG: Zn-dependent hydrolase [Ignavibacteriota bacterium]